MRSVAGWVRLSTSRLLVRCLEIVRRQIDELDSLEVLGVAPIQAHEIRASVRLVEEPDVLLRLPFPIDPQFHPIPLPGNDPEHTQNNLLWIQVLHRTRDDPCQFSWLSLRLRVVWFAVRAPVPAAVADRAVVSISGQELPSPLNRFPSAVRPCFSARS